MMVHHIFTCFDVFRFLSKASKKFVSKEISKELHSKAEPFIKWLKEAEEESSEEDEVEVGRRCCCACYVHAS